MGCGNQIILERGIEHHKREGEFGSDTSLLAWMNGQEKKLEKA